MKNLFLCSYFIGVKEIFKDFMNNDTNINFGGISKGEVKCI